MKRSQWFSPPDRARCSLIKIYFFLKKIDKGRSIPDATVGLFCKHFKNKSHENEVKGDDFTSIFLFYLFIRLLLRILPFFT